MSDFKMIFFYVSFLCLFYYVQTVPQNPEINDQFIAVEIETSNTIEETNKTIEDTNKKIEENVIIIEKPLINGTERTSESTAIGISVPSITAKICESIRRPIYEFISTPKVLKVLRNIGTCIVNGAMELISYFFPAPFIPLIASAAGLVIPFEPVVLLREKMPVTSYRRAFSTAVNTFLGTFDKFKRNDDPEPDPYMTRRFNRRLMDISSESTKKQI